MAKQAIIAPATTPNDAAAAAVRKVAPGFTSGRADGSKLAAIVADQIVGDIAKAGWSPGEIVGSEAELLERYGVSRAVFREAVRLLEHLHVARMRRGPGGGLMVMEPTVDSVTDAVSVYLYYVGAEIDEVFEARLTLEEVAAELAPQRLQELDIAALRALLVREAAGEEHSHRELHNLVASISRNPALAFFVDLLNRATQLYLPSATKLGRDTLTASAGAHTAIADAILAGEGTLARRRMQKHLKAEAEFLRARRPSRRRLADLPDVVGRSDKRAEQLARKVLREIAAAGWPVGELLGSEAELMERHDVSRAVLREAVRVLEHHQVAKMRRGPGGGLFVSEPGVEAVTEAVALQIDRLGILPAHLFEVRTAVEMAVLDHVVAHLDADGEAALRAALADEEAATDTELLVMGHDLHAVLAAVAGNRVMELLVLVLIRLTKFHGAAPPESEGVVPTGEVMHVHHRLVDAILDRDLDLARHRMRRHLDALARWTR
ncbi:MAG: FCD domain-containing protein [Actinomycetota bacterium]|nr:FCD domain-containing protein [Actinomycetota bacterium]